jgi:hypothetical protein
VGSWRWHQRREARNEVERLQHEVRRAVSVQPLQSIPDLALRRQIEPLRRHRRPAYVARESLKLLPLSIVWVLQGLDLAFRVGFMVGDDHWAIDGTILALLGVGLPSPPASTSTVSDANHGRFDSSRNAYLKSQTIASTRSPPATGAGLTAPPGRV